jgi:hypothetical protein
MQMIIINFYLPDDSLEEPIEKFPLDLSFHRSPKLVLPMASNVNMHLQFRHNPIMCEWRILFPQKDILNIQKSINVKRKKKNSVTFNQISWSGQTSIHN